MSIALARAPIDEVVVGVVLDKSIGPDAVEAGRYLVERAERFTRHEIHEPILSEPGIILGPTPVRVWLVSADDAWIVQLQPERFHANWRRRGDAAYPGFSRAGGAMHFALGELERFRDYCARTREGTRPEPISVELSKIDLLIQGKHWTDAADAALMMPVLSGVQGSMKSPSSNVSLRWWDELSDGTTIAVSVMPARLKADMNVLTYRVEFHATAAITDGLEPCLLRANQQLNEAFERLIPSSEWRRFS